MRAVKQKMVNSGHNPDDLDEFSYRRIRWLTDRPKDDGWTKIWEGDNSEYYKLLNLGVPVDAVRLRMEGDGYDPDTLDVGLFRKVQIRMKKEDFEYDEETETYYYPCPCGDRFEITREMLADGEDVATCPSCSLIVKVIYDIVS